VPRIPAELLVRRRMDGRSEEADAGERREEEWERGSQTGGFPTDSTLLDSVGGQQGSGPSEKAGGLPAKDSGRVSGQGRAIGGQKS